MKHRTPAYWPTRIMLAVGCIAAVVAVAVALALVLGVGMQEPLHDSPLTVLGVPASIVILAVSLVPVFIGFVWMLRIFRGARDKPPAWRYRDR